MKKIALIFGSKDSEHEVSISSAFSVYEHFPKDIYDCELIYISKDGRWFHGNYDFENSDYSLCDEIYLRFDQENPGFYNINTKENLNIDAAFLMLHGKSGEGGSVQGLLELAHIPYTGSELLSSAVCMDKIFTHEICEAHGIPMANFKSITKLEELETINVDYPCIVKPSREGSSFGVSYVATEKELNDAVSEAFKYDNRILIEEYIEGVEVGVAVFSTKKNKLISDVDQVNVSGDVFDFQEKYHPHRTETLAKAEFPKEVTEKIRALAGEIFDLLNCRHLSRLDFFVTKDHKIYFNEVNTIPGFTVNSRYPQMIMRQGLEFRDLIAGFIGDIL